MKNKQQTVSAKVIKRNKIRKSKISVKRNQIKFMKQGLMIEQFEGRRVKLALPKYPITLDISPRRRVIAPRVHKISYRKQQRMALKRKRAA